MGKRINELTPAQSNLAVNDRIAIDRVNVGGTFTTYYISGQELINATLAQLPTHVFVEGNGTYAIKSYVASVTADGHYSFASGQNTEANANHSFIHSKNSVINASAERSAVIGGENITATVADTVYIPYLNIQLINSNASVDDLLVVDTDGTVSKRSVSSLNIASTLSDILENGNVSGDNNIILNKSKTLHFQDNFKFENNSAQAFNTAANPSSLVFSNSITNKLYVLHRLSNVIDDYDISTGGSTVTFNSSINVSNNPQYFIVNTVNNYIYISKPSGTNDNQWIDLSTNTVNVVTDTNPDTTQHRKIVYDYTNNTIVAYTSSQQIGFYDSTFNYVNNLSVGAFANIGGGFYAFDVDDNGNRYYIAQNPSFDYICIITDNTNTELFRFTLNTAIFVYDIKYNTTDEILSVSYANDTVEVYNVPQTFNLAELKYSFDSSFNLSNIFLSYDKYDKILLISDNSVTNDVEIYKLNKDSYTTVYKDNTYQPKGSGLTIYNDDYIYYNTDNELIILNSKLVDSVLTGGDALSDQTWRLPGKSGTIALLSDLNPEILYSNIVFVDPILGDNSTGEINNLNKPYLTINTAISAVPAGSLVYLRPGVYDAQSVVLKSGVSIYAENATVNTSSSNILGNTGNVSDIKVWGNLNLNLTTTSNVEGAVYLGPYTLENVDINLNNIMVSNTQFAAGIRVDATSITNSSISFNRVESKQNGSGSPNGIFLSSTATSKLKISGNYLYGEAYTISNRSNYELEIDIDHWTNGVSGGCCYQIKNNTSNKVIINAKTMLSSNAGTTSGGIIDVDNGSGTGTTYINCPHMEDTNAAYNSGNYAAISMLGQHNLIINGNLYTDGAQGIRTTNNRPNSILRFTGSIETQSGRPLSIFGARKIYINNAEIIRGIYDENFVVVFGAGVTNCDLEIKNTLIHKTHNVGDTSISALVYLDGTDNEYQIKNTEIIYSDYTNTLNVDCISGTAGNYNVYFKDTISNIAIDANIVDISAFGGFNVDNEIKTFRI